MPLNVFWFEVLLYLSLTLDALSLAALDRTPTTAVTEQDIMATAVINGCLLLLVMYLISLAARRRKSWARWALVALFVLTTPDLLVLIANRGIELTSAIGVVSSALTVAAFYLSFTGDAKGWFNA